MKLHIDGVEQEVPGIEIDNGVSLYVDHAGAVRATRTVQPEKTEDQLSPQEKQSRRIAELEAQLAERNAPPPPPPDENEN